MRPATRRRRRAGRGERRDRVGLAPAGDRDHAGRRGPLAASSASCVQHAGAVQKRECLAAEDMGVPGELEERDSAVEVADAPGEGLLFSAAARTSLGAPAKSERRHVASPPSESVSTPQTRRPEPRMPSTTQPGRQSTCSGAALRPSLRWASDQPIGLPVAIDASAYRSLNVVASGRRPASIELDKPD